MSAEAKRRAPLRVCHLTKYYPPAPGGIETHVSTLARAQAKLGAKVHVLCVNHRDKKGRDITWQRFGSTPTLDEQDGLVNVTRVGRLASMARLDLCPELPLRILKLQSVGFDLLHLHVPNPTMLLAVALVGMKMPLVVTYQSDVVRQKLLAKVQRPFENRVFGKARAIFCTSPKYAEGSSFLAKFPSKVESLPFGIDPEPYLNPSAEAQACAARLQKQHGSPLWLCIGRLVYYKGLHIAIEALQHVPGKLLVIGVGPLGEQLRRQAKDLGVCERIIWQGHASDQELVGAYHAATALWFPSNARSEGFGLVQVEAMASGCPVINTAIPFSGVSWVSQHEQTGLTVPVEDSTAFAAAANRLLAEPALRHRFGMQARQRTITEFDHMLMARRCLEAYANAV